MKTNDIKRLYLKGWTRVQIAEEICYQDHDIEFQTAMEIVEEVLLKLQRRPAC
jgi:hypothetical protein